MKHFPVFIILMTIGVYDLLGSDDLKKNGILDVLTRVNDYWQSNNSQVDSAFWYNAALSSVNLPSGCYHIVI